MGQNYSARLGSGARGEKDLREVISSDGLIGKGLMVGQGQVVVVASDTVADSFDLSANPPDSA